MGLMENSLTAKNIRHEENTAAFEAMGVRFNAISALADSAEKGAFKKLSVMELCRIIDVCNKVIDRAASAESFLESDELEKLKHDSGF